MLQVSSTVGMPSGKGLCVSELSDEEKKVIAGVTDILDAFEALRPNIPIHQVKMLFKLALDEGRSQKAYSEKWEYPPSTVSRAMLDLGKRTRKGEEGLGLVEERVSAHSLREHEVMLSVKGKNLLIKLARKLCK